MELVTSTMSKEEDLSPCFILLQQIVRDELVD